LASGAFPEADRFLASGFSEGGVLDIQILPAATMTVLRFDGELTTTGAAAVRAATQRLRQGGRLVVDLGGVRGVDRPGLAALVALLMKAKGKARSVKVSGCTPSVVDLLHREGIDRLFPLHPGTVPAVSGR
jgi:anti-sigma B factor antagonist